MRVRQMTMTMTAERQQPAYLSVEEAAVILRVNKHTLYREVAAGNVPGVVKIGRVVRIRRSALLPDAEQVA